MEPLARDCRLTAVTPPRVRAAIVAVLIAAVSWGASKAGVTLAVWTDQQATGGNSFSTATLAAPTGLGAVGACNGWNTAKVTVSWTAASLADGYDVYRSTTNGGPYGSSIGHTTNTTYVDTGRAVGTTYYYVIRSTRNNWTSVNSSQVSATTPGVCLS